MFYCSISTNTFLNSYRIFIGYDRLDFLSVKNFQTFVNYLEKMDAKY